MLNLKSGFLIFNNISIEGRESGLTIAAGLFFLGCIILFAFLLIQNAIRASKIRGMEKLKRERLKKFSEQNRDLYVNDNDRNEAVLKLKKINTENANMIKNKKQQELEDEQIKYDIYKVKEMQDKMYNKPPSNKNLISQKEEEKEKLQQELVEKKRRLEEIKRAVNDRLEENKEPPKEDLQISIAKKKQEEENVRKEKLIQDEEEKRLKELKAEAIKKEEIAERIRKAEGGRLGEFKKQEEVKNKEEKLTQYEAKRLEEIKLEAIKKEEETQRMQKAEERKLEELKKQEEENIRKEKLIQDEEAKRLEEIKLEAIKKEEETQRMQKAEERKLEELKKQEEEKKLEQLKTEEARKTEEEEKIRNEKLEELKRKEELNIEAIRKIQEEERIRRQEEERLEEEENARRQAEKMQLNGVKESRYLEELRIVEEKKFSEERQKLEELRKEEEKRLEEEKKKLELLKQEEIKKLESAKEEEKRKEIEAKLEKEKVEYEEEKRLEEERRRLIEFRAEEEKKLEEEKRKIEELKQQEEEVLQEQEKIKKGEFNPLDLIEQQFTSIDNNATGEPVKNTTVITAKPIIPTNNAINEPENKVKDLLRQADLKKEDVIQKPEEEKISLPPIQKELLKNKETKSIKELLSKVPRDRVDNGKMEEYIEDVISESKVTGEELETKVEEEKIPEESKEQRQALTKNVQVESDIRKSVVENKTRSILEKINLIDEIEKKENQNKYGVMNTLADDYRKIILVISPENAGKTTIAINLAYELANRGISTTLIDTDNIKKDIYYYFPDDYMGCLGRLPEFEAKEELYNLGIKVNESLTIFTENKSIEYEIDFQKLIRLIHYANQINEAVIIDVKTDMNPQQVRTLMDLTPYMLAVVDKRLTTINRLADKFSHYKDIFVNKPVDLVINMDEGQRGLNKGTIKNFIKKLEYTENGKTMEYAIQTKEIFSVAYDTKSIIIALTSKLPAIMAKDNKIIFDIKKIGSYYFPN